MSASNPRGNESFWVDGQSFSGLSNQKAIQTNQETFWVDGSSASFLFPPSGGAILAALIDF